MSTHAINLTIEQGEDFFATFSILDPDETQASLNSYTVYSSLRKHFSSSTAYNFTTSLDESQGTITISMSREVTATLAPGRYYYDVFVISPEIVGNTRKKVVEGNAIVNGSATKL